MCSQDIWMHNIHTYRTINSHCRSKGRLGLKYVLTVKEHCTLASKLLQYAFVHADFMRLYHIRLWQKGGCPYIMLTKLVMSNCPLFLPSQHNLAFALSLFPGKHRNELKCNKTYSIVYRTFIAQCWNVFKCIAIYCNVLQCIANDGNQSKLLRRMKGVVISQWERSCVISTELSISQVFSEFWLCFFFGISVQVLQNISIDIEKQMMKEVMKEEVLPHVKRVCRSLLRHCIAWKSLNRADLKTQSETQSENPNLNTKY